MIDALKHSWALLFGVLLLITIVALVFASIRIRAALKARTKRALQAADAAAPAPAAA